MKYHFQFFNKRSIKYISISYKNILRQLYAKKKREKKNISGQYFPTLMSVLSEGIYLYYTHCNGGLCI